MTGYCARCHASVEMTDPKPIELKNGRPAQQGTCPTCGAKVMRIGAAK